MADPQDPPPPGATPAPSYTVPVNRIVTIEHPAIVHNFEKGVKSLGNDSQLKHVSGDIRLYSR